MKSIKQVKKEFEKTYKSFNEKRKNLTNDDVYFLLNHLIDEDIISFSGNNGNLNKSKYDINVINLSRIKNKMHYRISFNLNNQKDYYDGDEILKRVKNRLININKK